MAAASSLKRGHLELAGDSNTGQDCVNAGRGWTAATRVLAGARVHDAFVPALAQRAQATRATGIDVADAQLGPLNSAAQLARAPGFLEPIPEHAQIVAGSRPVGERGYCVAPTVLTGLRRDGEMVDEGTFDPVVTVQRFSSEQEAVPLATGTRYGLASSVRTTDHGCAMRMSKALDFGAISVNTHIPAAAGMPHSRFEHSGYGKDLSVYGVGDSERLEPVMHDTGP